MRKFICAITLFLCSITLNNTLYAQVDTLRTLDKQLLISNLDTGLKQFLVYMVDKESGELRFMTLWNRKTEKANRDGKEVFRITQEWLAENEQFRRSIFTDVNSDDFTSIYHWTSRIGTIEAFNFSESRIWGADSVENNSKADFEVEAQPYTLNWELDLETFEILPYAKGKKFAIHFHHPGSKTPPKFYLYEVIGSEVLKSAGAEVDCWKLKIVYDGGTNNATFWISKKNRQVLKMEEHFNSVIRYKVRLGTDINSSS